MSACLCEWHGDAASGAAGHWAGRGGVRFGSHSAVCPRPALALQAEALPRRSLVPRGAFSPKPRVLSSPGLSVIATELQCHRGLALGRLHSEVAQSPCTWSRSWPGLRSLELVLPFRVGHLGSPDEHSCCLLPPGPSMDFVLW